MNSEIGSEFSIDLARDLPEMALEASFLSKLSHYVLTISGRGAISLVLRSISSRVKTLTAALPMYLCDSILQSFRSNGYSCRFYKIGSDLSPDLGSIEELPEIGVFFHLGYFGFSTNNNLGNVVKSLRSRGVIAIEDRTHNFFSRNSDPLESDYYIASLRKWLGLPGGALAWSFLNRLEDASEGLEHFVKLRREAMLLKGRYLVDKCADPIMKTRYLELFGKAEAILVRNSDPYCLDSFSRGLLFSLDASTLKLQRRKNFFSLLKSLKFNNNFYPVFNELPADVTPFFFPVYVKENRDKLKSYLVGRSIYCPVHWPVPAVVQKSSYDHCKAVYDMILSIPCDQRYSSASMQKLADVLNDYFYKKLVD